MNLLTPAKACTYLKGFLNRITRLEKNEYTNKRFFTYDINMLNSEINKIGLVCSIAIHNKNKEQVKQLIDLVDMKIKVGRELLYNNKNLTV